MMSPTDPVEAAQRHLETGRPDLARKALETAVARAPRDARINRNLGAVLARTKDYPRGTYHAQRATELEPSNAENWDVLAEVLMQAGKHAEAARAYDKSIAANARRPDGYAGLAQAKLFVDDVVGALAAYSRAVQAVPGEVELWRGYGSLLLRLCRHEEAAAVLRRGVAANPERPEIDDLLCHVLNYIAGNAEANAASSRPGAADSPVMPVMPAEVFEAHRQFGLKVAAHIRPVPIVWKNTKDPARPLRVGYLSPDFRGHSCAHFIEPLLRHHDRSKVEPYCFFTGGRTDEVSDRLRALATWRDVSEAPVRDLAETIRRDEIDILVELSGHTAGHSLLGLARRAAPIQMTYLGYPNTTGLGAIDHRIIDALTDPPGAETLATERLIRLPGCFLCYEPPYSIGGETMPDPGWASTNAAEPIMFGSFNMVQKINARLVGVWASVLKAVPDSRMLLKCDARLKAVRERVLGWFAAEGIGPERLELAAMTKTVGEHLAMYRRVHVALDTFPYNGTTTTCEALWMGVPVVSLRGDVHASRVGLSLLTAVGLPDLCAGRADEFVTVASRLARDRDRLASLRAGLRDQLLKSPLCDGAAFARNVEEAYRNAWGVWCRG